MHSLGLPHERTEKLLRIIDPYSNSKITFSECVQLLSSEMLAIADGSEVAILELIANSKNAFHAYTR